MNSSLLPEGRQMRTGQRAHRRRLLQLALTITAGGGLQSLASSHAFAAEPHSTASAAKGQSSTSRRSGMALTMQEAIKSCLDCHSMCLQMATGYCLERGGRHVQQAHLRLLLNCAELCQTSANFMLSNSPLHGRVCLICAEVCEACAKSCEEVGDMRDCVEECQRCAKSCRTMT